MYRIDLMCVGIIITYGWELLTNQQLQQQPSHTPHTTNPNHKPVMYSARHAVSGGVSHGDVQAAAGEHLSAAAAAATITRCRGRYVWIIEQ